MYVSVNPFFFSGNGDEYHCLGVPLGKRGRNAASYSFLQSRGHQVVRAPRNRRRVVAAEQHDVACVHGEGTVQHFRLGNVNQSSTHSTPRRYQNSSCQLRRKAKFFELRHFFDTYPSKLTYVEFSFSSFSSFLLTKLKRKINLFPVMS